MERIAYIFLGFAFLGWLGQMIFGFIRSWPFGIFGFLLLIGFGLILAKVLRERRQNAEDDYYSKHIQK